MRRTAFLLVVLAGLSAAVAQTPAPAERPPERLPSISERVRSLSRQEGFLPYVWDERRGQLLLEIPSGLGDFLYGSGLASGAGLTEVSLDRGQLGQLGICRFQRVGPRVLLRQMQTTHRSGVSDAERTRVVEESFPSAVLAALPIVAEEADRVLVDATSFLLADSEIVPALKQARLGDWKQDLLRSSLSLSRSGAFPRNTELEVLVTLTSENPPRAVASVL
ncbi:MAG TPA: DUF5117 domain-containing protein, partial [Thermoanaerobaculia bacterium]|nr:DUF5117 domain-containing protein [Thermoanaerobaculia bacterium]